MGLFKGHAGLSEKGGGNKTAQDLFLGQRNSLSLGRCGLFRGIIITGKVRQIIALFRYDDSSGQNKKTYDSLNRNG